MRRTKEQISYNMKRVKNKGSVMEVALRKNVEPRYNSSGKRKKRVTKILLKRLILLDKILYNIST